jgi:hypothetical protein
MTVGMTLDKIRSHVRDGDGVASSGTTGPLLSHAEGDSDIPLCKGGAV